MEENILVPILDFFLDQSNINNPKANGSNRVEGIVCGNEADLTTNYLNGVGEITGYVGDNNIHISYNAFINRFAFKFSLDGNPPFIADKADILLVLREHLITPDKTPEQPRPDIGDLGESDRHH